MTALTPQELYKYVPTLSILNPIEAEGLILRAQGMAESCYGANRELEPKDYVDNWELLPGGEFKLRFFPLLKTKEIKVEIKNKSLISFDGAGGGLPLTTDWELLEPCSYRIFYEEDTIEFVDSFLPSFSFGRVGMLGVRNRPMQKRPLSEIKISYRAGFDFSLDIPSPEVKKMKSAIAAIAEVMYREQKGVKSESSDGNSITYFQNFQNPNPFLDYLAIFHKYRPRGRI